MTLILVLISAAAGAIALAVIGTLIAPGHEMTRAQYADALAGLGIAFAAALVLGIFVSRWVVVGIGVLSVVGMMLLTRLYWAFPRPLSRLARLFRCSRGS
jgi:hypothetical protein